MLALSKKFPTSALSSILIGFCLLSTVSSFKDDTLIEGAFGEDVVDSVLRRLSRSEIFSEDNSFLLRLAYVESRFGTDDDTFRQEYHGGIWQVEESTFRLTQTNHSSLTNLHQQIESKLEIDWLRVSWRTLRTPLYSALAAALYFELVPVPIPQTVPEQAAHWVKYYRNLGDLKKFIEDSEDLRERYECGGKLDLCIVLDSSGSINQQDPLNYDRAKNFSASLIESFTLDYSRIGMLVYSQNVRDIFELQNDFTIPEMSELARNAAYLDASTRTDLGINRAIQMFRDAPIVEGVPRVLIVLTDGNSDTGSDLPGAIDSIRENGIKSISVGIGSAIDLDELLFIALGDSRSVFQVQDFRSLEDFLLELTSLTCDIPQQPEVNRTYDDNLGRNERRVYHIELPPEGLTVLIVNIEGSTVGYWSLSEEVPNSAVHDGTLGASTYIPYPSCLTSRIRQVAHVCPIILHFTIQGVEDRNRYSVRVVQGRV